MQAEKVIAERSRGAHPCVAQLASSSSASDWRRPPCYPEPSAQIYLSPRPRRPRCRHSRVVTLAPPPSTGHASSHQKMRQSHMSPRAATQPRLTTLQLVHIPKTGGTTLEAFSAYARTRLGPSMPLWGKHNKRLANGTSCMHLNTRLATPFCRRRALRLCLAETFALCGARRHTQSRSLARSTCD